MFEDRLDLNPAREGVERLKTEIRKIIVGQDKMIELLVAAILSNGHVLIEGFPGLAKTLTAKILSRTISSDFKRIQFTPDMMPSDVIGTSIFNFKTSDFEYRKGPIFTNLVLIDEINRAPAKTQAALFEVMEERQITNEGKKYSMDTPFMIVATQNPIDLEGTYRLPEAQMDRFLFKINVDYPNLTEEVQILNGIHHGTNNNDLTQINAVFSEKEIVEYQQLASKIHVEENLIEYIAQIIQNTRLHKDISIGASPRASIALLRSSKAMALMRGRDFVTPDDIVDVTVPVINHRITISPEKEMEGTTAETIINNLVNAIEIPR